MRTVVIGDIHGCSDELSLLLDCLSVTLIDTLVFLGDLVDRGPDSNAVVNQVKQLACNRVTGNTGEFILIRGNHEEKHERWHKHEKRVQLGEISNNPIKSKEVAHVAQQMSKDNVDFLYSHAQLFYQFTIANQEFIAVHGGVPGWLKELPTHETMNKLSKKKLKRLNDILRIRYQTPSGHMVSLGKECDDDVFWARNYDGRFGHCFFGHQPFMQSTSQTFEHATGLDLGCVFGGWLCAAVIEHSNAEITWCTVRAKKKYSTKVYV